MVEEAELAVQAADVEDEAVAVAGVLQRRKTAVIE